MHHQASYGSGVVNGVACTLLGDHLQAFCISVRPYLFEMNV